MFVSHLYNYVGDHLNLIGSLIDGMEHIAIVKVNIFEQILYYVISRQLFDPLGCHLQFTVDSIL
jgi:hypothetical protein